MAVMCTTNLMIKSSYTWFHVNQFVLTRDLVESLEIIHDDNSTFSNNFSATREDKRSEKSFVPLNVREPFRLCYVLEYVRTVHIWQHAD
jgi:hypothetical protein